MRNHILWNFNPFKFDKPININDFASENDVVLIHDDLLATGGTAGAAAKLVEKLGGEVAVFTFVIELVDINGREKLGDIDVISLAKF